MVREDLGTLDAHRKDDLNFNLHAWKRVMCFGLENSSSDTRPARGLNTLLQAYRRFSPNLTELVTGTIMLKLQF